jgi:thiamine pyrophosphate-dependent acetolactate synthase large subunit-like protein
MGEGMSGGLPIRAPGTLDRRMAVAALLEDRGRMLVVSGLGSPTYDTFAAGDHAGNFYLWGAMGGAGLMGLGLALAQPDRPVTVITGDGEQLMGLGGLATIAVSAPKNLSIVVLDNGHYGETGGQLSHSGAGIDLGKVAAATGFTTVMDVVDASGLDAARKAIGTIGCGPRFITVRIAHVETPRALPARDGSWIKSRFRAHLGLGPS